MTDDKEIWVRGDQYTGRGRYDSETGYNERVEALIDRWLWRKYRGQGYPIHQGSNQHLRECPDSVMTNVSVRDGAGCDTGCEAIYWEADVSCPHNETEAWRGNEWDELVWAIEELTELDND